MDSKLRKGLFLVTLLAVLLFSGEHAMAAEPLEVMLPSVGIESVVEDYSVSEGEVEVEEYLVPAYKGEYLDMAFANVTSYLYVRSEPTKDSAWVGKLYPDDAAKITGPVGEWTPIESGNVEGYVKTEYIYVGHAAEDKAQQLVGQAEKNQEIEKFNYAESKAEEEARLKAEEEARIKAEEEKKKALAEEAAEKASGGQAVIDYACQFIGNPYVWGGTSLTNGADCSGFVQSVYEHFGIDVPRTSSEQRSAGVGVPYEEAIPGDIICYDGHVGLYMGNDEIVNARTPEKGIGVSSATYKTILSVRRVL